MPPNDPSVISPAQTVPVIAAPTSAVPAAMNVKSTDHGRSETLDSFLELSFRIGLGLVFIINSVSAIIQPAAFRTLIENNLLTHILGHTQTMLYLIAVNDGILGLLIFSGRKKKYVYAWAGIWLFIVTFMKFTSLV